MRFWAKAKGQRATGKAAVAFLMLALWAGTISLAASPSLHRLIHKDANSGTHQCLVTQIQQQQLLGVFAAVALPGAPSEFQWLESPPSFQFSSDVDYQLLPIRGPPSTFSSNLVVG